MIWIEFFYLKIQKVRRGFFKRFLKISIISSAWYISRTFHFNFLDFMWVVEFSKFITKSIEAWKITVNNSKIRENIHHFNVTDKILFSSI